MTDQVNQKKVILTFDDGMISHYTFVAPLLMKYSFNGTFFINGHLAGYSCFNKSSMNWAHARELERVGFEIGSHFYLHADMTQYSDKEIRDDILRNEGEFNRARVAKPISLSYPGFHVNSSIINTIKKMDYKFVRAGCEKTVKFDDFQHGGSGTTYNQLNDNPYNINCLGIFGKNYTNHWRADLQRLEALPCENTYGVFCFHGFDTGTKMSTSKEEFIEFIDYLVNNNYKVMSLRQIQE